MLTSSSASTPASLPSRGALPGGNQLRERMDRDADPATGTTGAVTVGGSVRGHFFAEHGSPSVSDTDWIRVTLDANTGYRFTLTLHGATATAGATIVGVYNSSGTKVADGATAPP